MSQSHLGTLPSSHTLPNKVSISHTCVTLCAGETGMGKKGEWVKTDKVRCSKPRGGVGKAIPHTFCVP